MTPKEKAKELVCNYQLLNCMFEHKDTDGTYFNLEGKLINSSAKQCALIAVDEILEAINGMVSEEHGYSADAYYIEVKQEIEAL